MGLIRGFRIYRVWGLGSRVQICGCRGLRVYGAWAFRI